jgi:hypothetical protein
MKARHCVEEVIILLIYVTIEQMAGALNNFRKTGINAALKSYITCKSNSFASKPTDQPVVNNLRRGFRVVYVREHA